MLLAEKKFFYQFPGTENTINLLIQNGAKVNVSNKFGQTALQMAAERGNL